MRDRFWSADTIEHSQHRFSNPNILFLLDTYAHSPQIEFRQLETNPIYTTALPCLSPIFFKTLPKVRTVA